MSPNALPDLRCGDERPRLALIEAATNVQGIDYLEVSPSQLELDVHFVQKETAAGRASLKTMLEQIEETPAAAVQVLGGERVRDIRVRKVRRVGVRLRVTVERPGDFSTYTLALRHPELDPPYASVAFSFKAGCPSRFDCRGDCDCDTPAASSPPVDYMAKDYDSFRQALLDRLPTIAPQWLERNEADLGIALIELLAYAGDQLSYLQDAVANEAYLDSARQRISVRRHARLLDYILSEGASARAFVAAEVSSDCTIAVGTQLLTRREIPFRGQLPPLKAVLEPGSEQIAERTRSEAAAVFETIADGQLHPALNKISIETWDLGECCLPVGTTTVDLEGDLWFDESGATRQDPWRLRAGSLLVIEETLGVTSGLEADADPTHRQVVRLTAAENVEEKLIGRTLTRVHWAPADALAFPLCVSCKVGEKSLTIAVARGNVLVADHGEMREQWWPVQPTWTPGAPALGGLTVSSRPTGFLLEEGPPSVWRGLEAGPVATMDAQPAQLSIGLEVYGASAPSDALEYTIAADLIEAGEFEPRFVAEVGNDGRARIRFGDGVRGLAPAPGSFVAAHYRVGRGLTGNVGAETIAHLLLDPSALAPPPLEALRNPLPASGGVDPETISQVKVAAPVAFRSPQQRAVTAADYAEVAMRHEGVKDAVARFRWTGSWLTVYLILDAVDREALGGSLPAEVKEFVQSYTQTGYDLEVQPATYAPLDVELFVCVAPERFRSDVEEELLAALSSRRLAGGGSGFFAAQRFAFGQPLYLSALYAAAAAVPGVESVAATRFSRFYDDDPPPARPITRKNIAAGLITVGDLEVLELMDDSSLPERGVLTITSGGGR